MAQPKETSFTAQVTEIVPCRQDNFFVVVDQGGQPLTVSGYEITPSMPSRGDTVTVTKTADSRDKT